MLMALNFHQIISYYIVPQELTITVMFINLILKVYSSSEILATTKLLNTKNGLFMFGALQFRPPDNKIYESIQTITSLSTINNPDVYGSGCNYQSNTINLTNQAVSWTTLQILEHQQLMLL